MVQYTPGHLETKDSASACHLRQSSILQFYPTPRKLLSPSQENLGHVQFGTQEEAGSNATSAMTLYHHFSRHGKAGSHARTNDTAHTF